MPGVTREIVHSRPWVLHRDLEVVLEVLVAYRLSDDPRKYYQCTVSNGIDTFTDLEVVECDRHGRSNHE